MREVEVSNLPGRVISAVQCCSMQHNQYQLIVSSQTQGQLTCLQVDDAAASQAVLADTIAAMQVQTAGQCCKIVVQPLADCTTLRRQASCVNTTLLFRVKVCKPCQHAAHRNKMHPVNNHLINAGSASQSSSVSSCGHHGESSATDEDSGTESGTESGSFSSNQSEIKLSMEELRQSQTPLSSDVSSYAE